MNTTTISCHWSIPTEEEMDAHPPWPEGNERLFRVMRWNILRASRNRLFRELNGFQR